MRQLLLLTYLMTAYITADLTAQKARNMDQSIYLLDLMPTAGPFDTSLDFYDIDPENYGVEYFEAYNQVISRSYIPVARVLSTKLSNQMPSFDAISSDFYEVTELYETYEVSMAHFSLPINVVGTAENGVQFCSHFSLSFAQNQAIIQCFEHDEDYNPSGLNYNFNIWARSPDDLESIIIEIIGKVEDMEFGIDVYSNPPIFQDDSNIQLFEQQNTTSNTWKIFDFSGREVFVCTGSQKEMEQAAQNNITTGYYVCVLMRNGYPLQSQKIFLK